MPVTTGILPGLLVLSLTSPAFLNLLQGSPPLLPPSPVTQCASHAFSWCVTEWICGNGKTFPVPLSLFLHLSLKMIHCTESDCRQEDFRWWDTAEDGCRAKAVQGSVDSLLMHLSCVFVQIINYKTILVGSAFCWLVGGYVDILTSISGAS